MALFGPSPIGSTEGHNHIVEMRAGKMFRQGTWVYPDDRKGSLYIYRNSDDLMHFCWRDRTTFSLEDDFIIFPGDCTYSRVKECKTGRVYVLKFSNSTVRMFYWLQEPKTDKDDEHCRRINYLLNHSPIHHTSPTPFNISQAQLSRIFGPEVAAQLSAIMNNEENSRFTGRSDSEERRQSDVQPKRDTSPISGVGTSSASRDQENKSKRRSSLKTDTSEPKDNAKKPTKSVTIIEDVQQDESRDLLKKKNGKNKEKESSKDDSFVVDYIDPGDEESNEDESTDNDENREKH